MSEVFVFVLRVKYESRKWPGFTREEDDPGFLGFFGCKNGRGLFFGFVSESKIEDGRGAVKVSVRDFVGTVRQRLRR